jgi:ADP-ribose pyrophosphatase YjhB (NUDIX family)
VSGRSGRAQCLVVRENAVLMVKTREVDRVFWCLPGGGIESGETPEEAAMRELREECCVLGKILRETSVTTYSVHPDDRHYTFLMEIGSQEPGRGYDPEFAADAQMIIGVGWRTLAQLSEKDRVFLWTAGLLSVPQFAEEALSWTHAVSHPKTEQ